MYCCSVSSYPSHPLQKLNTRVRLSVEIDLSNFCPSASVGSAGIPIMFTESPPKRSESCRRETVAVRSANLSTNCVAITFGTPLSFAKSGCATTVGASSVTCANFRVGFVITNLLLVSTSSNTSTNCRTPAMPLTSFGTAGETSPIAPLNNILVS